ncbi:GNAT family N-acetyltransferase [Spongiactinospora sp. TRM90649]|uniref:GNAT family N-acetyltransferase n=1 Tax=Spongiactinospora sp. TRM90649 TaxID=3031114 RepID=UPI0023FA2A83|nr:GNAT family N-acetyltransferase [Spongiactinospora sp. TRM90649]MDF5758727.1 GNAT family N-acetyltransferase [Spongiactinospora sp. TRM90649]
MNAFTIRPIGAAEWQEWAMIAQEAFVSDMPEEHLQRLRASVDFDRSLGAYDDDVLIGGAISLAFSMAVPGATLSAAGVTGVAVLPSHRRRGVLRGLMRAQLAGVRERGEPIAALYASEAPIYGRYGYGRAADRLALRIPTNRSAFRDSAPRDPALRVRIATPAAARADMEKVHDAAWPARPGMYRRDTFRWDLLFHDDRSAGGYGSLRCVLVEDDAGPRGYAMFRIRRGATEHDVPDGVLRLEDLAALDPAAYALIWRQVLDRDLVATVVAGNRPVDDPLLHLVADPRQLGAIYSDDLWLRLVDAGQALASRRYATEVDTVIELTDPVCPWNEGRWRLSADPSGSVCERTTDPADVALPADSLAAAYLGGRPLTPLAAAGGAAELTRGALARLSTAMSWEPRPWCGLVF